MLVLEILGTVLVGGFCLWLLAAGELVDRIRHRGEHPEARAARVLAEQHRWGVR